VLQHLQCIAISESYFTKQLVMIQMTLHKKKIVIQLSTVFCVLIHQVF